MPVGVCALNAVRYPKDTPPQHFAGSPGATESKNQIPALAMFGAADLNRNLVGVRGERRVSRVHENSVVNLQENRVSN
jgi:hypothetical protein